ncbi:MAG: hypothetical protein ACD_52C00094G0008 [uncultured bacterium]|nr:MAG: hypothetical protein ACD_52C00094G0008 [uncultured bacterium]
MISKLGQSEKIGKIYTTFEIFYLLPAFSWWHFHESGKVFSFELVVSGQTIVAIFANGTIEATKSTLCVFSSKYE